MIYDLLFQRQLIGTSLIIISTDGKWLDRVRPSLIEPDKFQM